MKNNVVLINSFNLRITYIYLKYNFIMSFIILGPLRINWSIMKNSFY